MLRRIVEDERPDLLVLGRHGNRWQPALALGSVSLHVLEEALVPTLVVPAIRTAARHRPGNRRSWRVLVGVDGSSPSLRALAVAADLAELFGGELVAATAAEEIARPAGTTATCELDTGTAMLEAACSPLQQRGVRVRTACQHGEPWRVLLDLATSLDADVVVVGTRGGGAPGDPLLGSVSRRVVHETSLPTLVVPGGWSESLFGETDRELAATDGATTATTGHGGARP